jgi:hypothetical protein
MTTIASIKAATKARAKYDGRSRVSIEGTPFKLAIPGSINLGKYGPQSFEFGGITFSLKFKGQSYAAPSVVPSKPLPASWLVDLSVDVEELEEVLA